MFLVGSPSWQSTVIEEGRPAIVEDGIWRPTGLKFGQWMRLLGFLSVSKNVRLTFKKTEISHKI